MAFDLEGARKELSDDEITDVLAKKLRFDVQGALNDGLSGDEILAALVERENTLFPPSAAKNTAQPSAQPEPEQIPLGFIGSSMAKGAAAASLPGIALNTVRGVSDIGRIGLNTLLGKALGYDQGEISRVEATNPNFVPTSNDVLKMLASKAGIALNEPQTSLEKLADQAIQYGTGGTLMGLPVIRSALSGVAGEAAGQLTEGTQYEIPARILASLGTDLGLSRIGGSKPAIKTAEEQKGLARQYYKNADALGGNVPAGALNKWYDKTIDDLSPKGPTSAAIKSGGEADSIVKKLTAIKEQSGGNSPSVKFDELQDIYSELGDLASKNVTAQGSYNALGKKFKDSQRSLISTVENMKPPAGVSKEALQSWKDGRDNWVKSIKTQNIERIITRAKSKDQPAKSISSGMASILENPNKSAIYTKKELEQIKKAADIGLVGEGLRAAGSRLTGTIGGTAGAAAIGGPFAAPVGTVAGYLASIPARKLGTALQTGKAEDVIRQIQLGRTRDYKPSALEMFMSKKDKEIYRTRKALQQLPVDSLPQDLGISELERMRRTPLNPKPANQN